MHGTLKLHGQRVVQYATAEANGALLVLPLLLLLAVQVNSATRPKNMTTSKYTTQKQLQLSRKRQVPLP
jgi:hypothetical protein